jgi:hypothetical protein
VLCDDQSQGTQFRLVCSLAEMDHKYLKGDLTTGCALGAGRGPEREM